jgi:hypothetical protein
MKHLLTHVTLFLTYLQSKMPLFKFMKGLACKPYLPFIATTFSLSRPVQVFFCLHLSFMCNQYGLKDSTKLSHCKRITVMKAWYTLPFAYIPHSAAALV